MKSLWRDPVVLLFFAVAILVTSLGLGLGWQQQREANWPRLPVTVESAEVVTNASKTYDGVVRVRLPDGQSRDVRTSWSSNSPEEIQEVLGSARAGESLGLAQNPEQPEDLRLPPSPNQRFLVWGLLFGGGLFAVVPVVVAGLSNRGDALRLSLALLGASGVGLILIGLAIGWSKVTVLREWPVVEARVVESQVALRPSRRSRHGLDLVVAYDVQGREFRSLLATRVRDSDPSRVEAERLRHYAVGSRHPLRYCPASPLQATLYASWSAAYFQEAIGVGLAGVLLALLAGLLFRGLSGRFST